MQHKTLKLSTLAVLIASVTQANAAVYKVVEVDPQRNAESEVLQLGYESKDLTGRVETYAQAIEASSGVNCFDTNSTCITDNSFKVAGESRVGTDGINYRDEVAFTYDLYQEVNDYSGFRNYCNNNLGFNTCDNWANSQYYGLSFNESAPYDGSGYGGLHREHAAWTKDYFSSALPFVESSSSLTRLTTFASDPSKYDSEAVAQLGTIVSGHETSDGVVSGIGSLEAGDAYTLGVSSSAYFTNGTRFARQFNKRGFVNLASDSFVLNPPVTNTLVDKMGQTLAWDAVEYNDGGTKKLLVVGSASYEKSKLDDERKLPDSDNDGFSLSIANLNSCSTGAVDFLYSTRECQHAVFANDAFFWTVDTTNGRSDAQLVANRGGLEATDPDARERSFQGSARAVALVNDAPVIAGYSTQSIENDFYAVTATIFTPKSGAGAPLVAEGWERKPIPGLDIKQGGDRKYRYTIATDINNNNLVIGVGKNFIVNNRSYAESMFIYDNASGSLKMLDSTIDSSIFFNGSNGYPSAINNSDQLVGWVDSESVNQVNGRQRRQRAFTYMAGGDISGSPLQANKAWMLDDLTNGGSFSTENNAFRIAQATDVNDAGVISATAFKCDGGYQSLSKESQCSSDEKVVAVKLIPIAGGTIEQRPEEQSTIKREGASLGLFALTLLGLIGFRRRK